MQRLVALDTETTGKSDDGTPGDHRIIEVGCVEIIDRKLTGRNLQLYVNPGRPVDEEAFNVHGISDQFLADKPSFSEVADELVDFIRGSELLIHNAKFDTGFMDKEWQLLGMTERTEDIAHVVDTVALAMHLVPGKQVNLDNLCKVFDIDASARTSHGALLDAQLLAEVYLAMTGGQGTIEFGDKLAPGTIKRYDRPQGLVLPKVEVLPNEEALHKVQVLEISQNHKISDGDPENGISPMAGSLFGDEFNMELLVKGKEEDKKVFAARQKAQLDEKIHELLSDKELELYKDYMQTTQKTYDEWVARVLGTDKNKKKEQ